MKGTSKPVLYRTIRNDNDDLTLHRLQHITYMLSFEYPYATKSTRMVPVIRHSSKLANQVVGFWKCKCPALACTPNAGILKRVGCAR
jgi:hypothetical protein